MSRKVCVVTGSRAEYGLLRLVMQRIRDEPALRLQVLATGSHLSPEFGLTYREIEADGFQIDRRVETLVSSDSEVGIAKSMALGLSGLADAFQDLRPDLLLLLGDRYEIFAAAAAALVARIPVAHLHGGEVTEGAFDESFRHAITKMSHLHFVAAEEYRRRVIQLGEQPERVFLVGGLGVDAIADARLLDRPSLERELGFALAPRSLLVTFHPPTLDADDAERQMSELLAALGELADTSLVFTLPNADNQGRRLGAMIRDFVATHGNARAYASLGQLRYLSCIAHVDGVVGNSSSGLTEVPSFRKGTVNVGDRQRGRLKAASVIDCEPDRNAIGEALRRLRSPEFQALLAGTGNPYGDGGASARIVATIKSIELHDLVKKPFHDLSAQDAGERP